MAYTHRVCRQGVSRLLGMARLVELAERQLQAVVDDPHTGANISGTNFVVTGWAIADEAGVRKVEISTDGGGTWNEVEILATPPRRRSGLSGNMCG